MTLKQLLIAIGVLIAMFLALPWVLVALNQYLAFVWRFT